MNSSMNSMMWKTTHRFGALLLGVLFLFAAYEIAHDEAMWIVLRVGGAGALTLLGLFALLKCVRPRGEDEAGPPARRLRKQRG